ncbi:hypothetical protein Syun_024399 [Stephania yunnanensis]|uniref:Uncharacterized protein n=1 Tax=Stephania yunnanensis TaxID=152371 RepID=A0AAP0I4C6_9MAGN
MTETGATRRRDQRDGETERSGATGSTTTGRRNGDHRERRPSEHRRETSFAHDRRRDETIERDGRLGTRRSTGATRRRDGFRFWGFFVGMIWGFALFCCGGVGCGKEKTLPGIGQNTNLEE